MILKFYHVFLFFKIAHEKLLDMKLLEVAKMFLKYDVFEKKGFGHKIDGIFDNRNVTKQNKNKPKVE